MSKWPLEKLGEHIIESKEQYSSEKLNGIQVLSVTNDQGFINSEKRTSENVSNYKVVKDKYFAYNPYRINVGSLAFAGGEYAGIVSPAYVVFYCASDLDPEYLMLVFFILDKGVRVLFVPLWVLKDCKRLKFRFRPFSNKNGL